MSAAVTAENESEADTARGRGIRALWPAASVLFALVFSAVHVVSNHRFFYADDTERGSFGQWWQLGDNLLHGRIPVLEPSAWQAGNYFAEGQWGLLNPVIWAISLVARVSESPALLATGVKLGFICVLALGVYLLARSFGAGPQWSAVAGALAPLTGFTTYMDAASWTTGLINAAVLPWVWWTLRRAVERGKSPIGYFVSCYLLVTFGYVFGVMVLVVVLVETLVRHLIRRDRVRILRSLAASAWGALFTVVTYLPGLLTASVTERGNSDFGNYFFLNADFTDLVAAGSPWTAGTIWAWQGFVTPAPLVYIAWLVPLFPLVMPMARSAVARIVPLLAVGGVMLFAVILPSHMGPIRWPLRFMPYLAIVVIVIFAVAASRRLPGGVTRAGIVGSYALILATAAVCWANQPFAWKATFGGMAVELLALTAILFVARSPRLRWREAARGRGVVAVVAAVTAIFALGTVYFFPTTPLPSVASPNSTSQMQRVLSGVDGDVIVVGNAELTTDPAAWDERLMANLWYLSPAPVSNLYTVLPHLKYSRDLGLDLRGNSGEETLKTLLGKDKQTGERVADLMGVSAIVAMREMYPDEPKVPAGWRVSEGGPHTWLVQRDEPVQGAGGVTWTGEGTRVTVTARSGTDVSFTVDSVGEDGRVVLSRLAYPGYGVSGATMAEPLRGWLLTVDVSQAKPGDTVTVSFRPPGFPLMVASAGIAVLLAAGWLLLRLRARRRGRVLPVAEAADD